MNTIDILKNAPALYQLVTVHRGDDTYRVVNGSSKPIISNGNEYLPLNFSLSPDPDQSNKCIVNMDELPVDPAWLHCARIRVCLVKETDLDDVLMTISRHQGRPQRGNEMTNPYRFKEASHWLAANYTGDYGPNDPVNTIREAMTMAETGMCLPVLPEDWSYQNFLPRDGEWLCQITHFISPKKGWECLSDTGPTPYAAAVNALERIGK